MEELDPLCEQFHEINLTDTFYDNLFLLCKYVDDEMIGDENATQVALEKFHNDADYNSNLYKMWLYLTISKWHKRIQNSNKFTTAEESCAIYLMRAIAEISRTAICYDGCNILTELKDIISHSFAEYTITGWKFLCSEHTFESLMKLHRSCSATSTHYVSEYEAEYLIEAYDENIDNEDEMREYENKCKELLDIATELLSSKFTLTLVRLASQKFVDRTLTLKSDFVFNVPKTYHVWVEPTKKEKKEHKKVDKKKSKDAKLVETDVDADEPEKESDLHDLYEIFPLRMSLEANSDEFWADLEKKYAAEQNNTKDGKAGNVSATDARKRNLEKKLAIVKNNIKDGKSDDVSATNEKKSKKGSKKGNLGTPA